MSSNEHTHTPGRLTVARDFEGNQDVAILYDDYDGEALYLIAEADVPFAAQPENARRLAACWNACINSSTDDLEKIGGDNDGVRLIALERTETQQQHTPGRLAWEYTYKELHASTSIPTSGEGFMLAEMGYEGWELVCVRDIKRYECDFIRYTFKRPFHLVASLAAAPATNTLPMSESLDGDVRMVPVKLDAAPLMKALRKIEQLCFEYEGDAKWTWHDLYAEAVRIARAAIAKAEGK